MSDESTPQPPAVPLFKGREPDYWITCPNCQNKVQRLDTGHKQVCPMRQSLVTLDHQVLNAPEQDPLN